jgi:putative transposase
MLKSSARKSCKGDIHLFDRRYSLRLVSVSMPRTARSAVGGLVYHVLNRGNGRLEVFRKPGDFHCSYLRTLLRYVEANPLRAEMAEQAEKWLWSSLGCDKSVSGKLLDPWPIDRPRNWTALVNEPLAGDNLSRVKLSFERGRPLGNDPWTVRMAAKLGVQYTLNPRGRPKLTREDA